MAVPFIPVATFQVDGSSQESMEKFANNGLKIGYNHEDRDSWVMISPYAPPTFRPKIFYVPTGGQIEGEDEYRVYAVSNVSTSDINIQNVNWIGWTGNPFIEPYYEYLAYRCNIPTEINDTYYRVFGQIRMSDLNPLIPIFETANLGFLTADAEGWTYRDPDNPYEFDDTAISYGGGGTGKFDKTSDTIGVPALPQLSAVSAGFISMYSPTLTQLNRLASFLWTDSVFDPDNFKKLFSDPMECIIGLTIVPVEPDSAGSVNVKVGYVDTGISMPRISSQYTAVNCGTLQANEFWGSALDYAPMTKLHIYLPYVGIREINPDEFMGKTIGVQYHVDLLSGALTAFVTSNGSVLYQYNGQCALNIPLAASNFTQMIQSAVSAIGAVGMTAAAGAGGPALSSMGAGALSSTLAGGAIGLGAGAANSAISSKPTFSHSGSMGGSGGMLGVQTPYIIIERPNQSMPKNLNKFCGYPSNIYYKLYDLTGFTQVEFIHLDNIPATDKELNEIDQLLKTGVIL